jgi:hypothetical protein
LTWAQLIERILRRVGQKNPSTQERNNCAQMLNVLIHSLNSDAKFPWAISNTETSLTAVSNQRAYATGATATTIPIYIFRLIPGQFFEYTNSQYTPIEVITKRESLTTFEREGTGQPYKVFLERATNPANNRLHLFPTPASAYTYKFTYQRSLYDLNSQSDNPDFPTDWFKCLEYGGAAEMGDEYAISDQTQGKWRGEHLSELKRLKGSIEQRKMGPVTRPSSFF